MFLQDKTIIVTGASRGIGRAIAEVCVREGARAGINVLKAHDQAVLLRAQLCGAAPDSAFWVPFDVRNAQAIRTACQPVLDAYGPLAGWVNNTGINLPGLFLTQSEAMMEQQSATNLVGTLLCSQFILEHMLPLRAGSIVNLGSVTSQRLRLDSRCTPPPKPPLRLSRRP